MKLGYSMLLSELLQSEAIGYEDCKDFQIVCPSCREPIFKGVRAEHTKEIHYLSHYAKDAAYVANCELRVSSISPDQTRKQNSQSRDQRLKYFLNVLQNAIDRALYIQNHKSAESRTRILKDIKNHKAIQRLRQTVLNFHRKQASKLTDAEAMNWFNGYFDFTVSKVGGFYKTSFAIETQKRIALDMYRHVLTLPAQPSFELLFTHAYWQVIMELTEDSKHRPLDKWESDLRNILVNVLSMNRETGIRLFEECEHMKLYPPAVTIPGFTMYQKIATEIMHEFDGILIRIPYFELLKEAQK
jgi:hypothetical protein